MDNLLCNSKVPFENVLQFLSATAIARLSGAHRATQPCTDEAIVKRVHAARGGVSHHASARHTTLSSDLRRRCSVTQIHGAVVWERFRTDDESCSQTGSRLDPNIYHSDSVNAILSLYLTRGA